MFMLTVYFVIMKGATRCRTFFIFSNCCDHTSKIHRYAAVQTKCFASN